MLAGKLKPEAIDEKQFARHLYTSGWPEVDFVYPYQREMRISNFLLWQMAYSEFYVTPTYWPDFTEELMDKAITDYSRRNRRFGDVKPAKTRNP